MAKVYIHQRSGRELSGSKRAWAEARRQIKVHSSTNASSLDQMTAHVAAAAVVSIDSGPSLGISTHTLLPHVLPCSQLWHALHLSASETRNL